MENATSTLAADPARLKRMVAVRIALAGPLLAAMFFLPAGTLDYWQAWAYLAVLLTPMCFVVAYFMKKDPQVLERRMRMKEKEPEQKAIIKWSYPLFLAAFLLPGLDRRFGWSAVPAWLVLAADIIVLAAYGMVFLVMRENRFLSRVVEVESQQRVISSGPYAVVRHPMYAAVMPLYFFSPLALGSFWALLPAAFIPAILVARLLNEEKVLGREMSEYRKYARRVKFRLIPGIW